MQNITINIQLYTFDELPNYYKITAIEKVRLQLLDLYNDDDETSDSIVNSDNVVLDFIYHSNYLFYASGEIANIITEYNKNKACKKIVIYDTEYDI